MKKIANWVNDTTATHNAWLDKINPATGKLVSQFANSHEADVTTAVAAAVAAFPAWSATTPVARGQLLAAIAAIMKQRKQELADCIALETGKPPKDAAGEVGAAILQCEYFAGEGMRLFGQSLTSGMPNKYSHTVRQPLGVAALIVPANTPIANIAWKLFPALICGNSVVLKASEDSPEIALLMAQIAKEAGLPKGVLSVVQGSGSTAGNALVNDVRVNVISFTGSTAVGKIIAQVAGKRLARVSLELGGKNPLLVCDDAELEQAVHWASLSAFSNAGQRCAAASRIIVMDKVYDTFRDKLVAKAQSLKLGVTDDCDLGPVINARQHQNILAAIKEASTQGGKILCGGGAPAGDGYYITPTLIEGLSADAELSRTEIFGPVACLYRVKDMQEALAVANDTEYGLTAAIHTTNVDRAMWFAQRIHSGLVNVNIGTFGSEPHMPFGGMGASGNGTREPGLQALDVYSEFKNISFLVREAQL